MKKFLAIGAAALALVAGGSAAAVAVSHTVVRDPVSALQGITANGVLDDVQDVDTSKGFFDAVQENSDVSDGAFNTASDDVSDNVFNSENDAEEAIGAAVLRQGSRGDEVREVQRRLKQWGYYKGAVDGIFGSGTKSAVIAFQKKNGLTADGVVGKATFKALGMMQSYNALQNSKPSSSTYTSSDLYLLAKAIYAEGRGESYTGQVAIGAVIMNRVKSSSFPNTISGVIYQKGAFTAVTDGQINLEPNQTAYNAARDAMNGWDPTYGCLYYYNPAVATSSWIFSRKTVTVIGKHVFAI